MNIEIRAVQIVDVIAITYYKGNGTREDVSRMGFSLYDKDTGVLLCEIDNINDLDGYPGFIDCLVQQAP
jgi:hypothetical protein